MEPASASPGRLREGRWRKPPMLPDGGLRTAAHWSNRIDSMLPVNQSPPKIPRGDGAVWPPFLSDLEKLFLRREFSATKGFRETLLHAVVRHGPDIQPAKFEEKQHFHGYVMIDLEFDSALLG